MLLSSWPLRLPGTHLDRMETKLTSKHRSLYIIFVYLGLNVFASTAEWYINLYFRHAIASIELLRNSSKSPTSSLLLPCAVWCFLSSAKILGNFISFEDELRSASNEFTIYMKRTYCYNHNLYDIENSEILSMWFAQNDYKKLVTQYSEQVHIVVAPTIS